MNTRKILGSVIVGIHRQAWLAVLALTLAGASTEIRAQVFNQPAPVQNAQILTLSGSALPGNTVTATLTGMPGSAFAIILSVLPAELPFASGIVLIDPNWILNVLVGSMGPTGEYTVSGTVNPATPPGSQVQVQAAVLTPGGTLILSNRSVIVTQAPLALSILSPAHGSVVNSSTPPLAISFSQGANTASLHVFLDGTEITSQLTVLGTGAGGNLSNLANGPHTLTATVMSPAGQPASAASTFQVSTAVSGGVASVSGTLIDPDGFVPIVGARVFFVEGGPTVTTTATGAYTIAGAPVGIDLALHFDPSTAVLPPGAAYYYPPYARPVTVYEGAHTQTAPVYLPKVFPQTTFQLLENQGFFSCSQSRFLQDFTLTTTMGISLTFPSGTYVSFAGNPPPAPCSQNLAIAPVDTNNPPTTLPAGFDPSLLITIQPTGMRFWTAPPGSPTAQPRPLPISFPNTQGFANGNQFDIYSVDPDIGEFRVTGIVTVQGAQLVTTTGGIFNGSWHFMGGAPPGSAGPGPGGPGGPKGGGCSPEYQMRTGYITETHRLVKRRIFDEPFGPDLVYDSRSVITLLPQRMHLEIPVTFAIPCGVTLSGRLTGVPSGADGYFDTRVLNENIPHRLDLAHVFDVSGLSPGVYGYRLDANVSFGLPIGSWPTFPFCGGPRFGRSVEGTLEVVTRPEGSFGRGWSLSDDHRILGLNTTPGSLPDDLLIQEGGGIVRRYRNAALLSDPGLRLRMYAGASQTAMLSYFATSAPGTFEVHQAGSAPVPALSTVIPNVKFWQAPGPYFLHVGADGIQQTIDPAQPAGDDIVYRAPNGQDSFGALLEGQLNVPTAGAVTFSVFADDAFSLEVNGTTVASLSGTNPNGNVTSLPISLPAGPVPFRLAYLDAGGASHLWVMAVGGGMPAGILASNRLYTGSPGASGTAIGRWAGVGGDYSGVTFQVAGGVPMFRCDLPDGGLEMYDAAGRIQSRTDRNSRTTTYTRDPAGRILSITDPAGGVTTLAYAGSQVTAITDPAGRATALTYNGTHLASVTDPTGATWSYGFDGRDLLTSISDPAGNVETITYDSLGHYTGITYPGGARKTLEAAQARGLALGSTGALPVIPLTADSYVSRAVDELGQVFTVKYEPGYQVVAGRSRALHTYTNALGHVETRFIDERTDLPVLIVRRNGSRINLVQDFERGLLIRATEDGGTAATTDDRRVDLTWEAVRPYLTSITSAAGTPFAQTMSIMNDANGNPVAVSLSTGPGVSSTGTATYGSLGLRIAATDPTGLTTMFSHDPATFNTRQTVTPSTTASSTFDAAGNEITFLRPGGIQSSFNYNARGQLTRVLEPTGGQTDYEYWPAGPLKRVTDQNGGVYDLVYDARGRFASVTGPLGFFESRSYLANGLVSQLTRADGSVISYLWDALGRNTQIAAPGLTTTFGYDVMDGLISAVAPSSSVDYQYNGFGDVVSELQMLPGLTGQLASAYDASGRRSSSTTSINGVAVKATTYGYDLAGRPTSLVDAIANLGGPAVSLAYAFGYDAASRRTSLSRNGGIVTTLSYAQGELASVLTAAGASTLALNQLTRDAGGNVTMATDQRAGLPPDVTTWQYEHFGRVLAETHTSGLPNANYGPYDLSGNRRANTHVYDARQRMLSDGVSFYDYDANGNTVAKRPGTAMLPRREFLYDGRGRMTTVRDLDAGGVPTVVGTYTYDAHGRRTSKNGHRFVYDREDVVAVVDPSGSIQCVTHGPGIDEPLAVTDAGGPRELIADWGGTIVQSVQGGAATANRTYDAFGRILAASGSVWGGAYDPGYRGRELDAETSLSFNRARYLDTSTGRFSAVDPIWLTLSLSPSPFINHPYVYVGGFGIALTDPIGMNGTNADTLVICELIAGLVVGGTNIALDLASKKEDDEAGVGKKVVSALGPSGGKIICKLIFGGGCPPDPDGSDEGPRKPRIGEPPQPKPTPSGPEGCTSASPNPPPF